MSKPKAPKSPDYAAQARAQGRANVDAALATAALNQPNVQGPYGSIEYGRTGEAGLTPLQIERQRLAGEFYNRVSKVNPGKLRRIGLESQYNPYDFSAVTDQQLRSFGARGRRDLQNLRELDRQIAAAGGWGTGTPGGYAPGSVAGGGGSGGSGGQFGPGDFTQTTTLDPAEQQRLDAQRANDMRLNEIANAMADRSEQNAQTPLDYSNLPDVFSGAEANRRRAEEAIYNDMTRFMDERYGREEESRRSRLAAMGFSQGQEGYDTDIQEFLRGKGEDYQRAMDRSVIMGGQEASRSFGENLTARQQGIDEMLLNRDLPYQDFQRGMAALSGTHGYLEPRLPQGAGGSGAGVTPPPLFDAANAQYADQQGRYQQQTAQYNQNAQAAAQLAMLAFLS